MNGQASETIFSLLVDRAAESPDRLALIANQRGRWVTTSVQQLVERIAALSLALSKLGITKGDRVAILVANDPEWLVIDIATQVIGAVSVAVPSHSESEALTATLQELGAVAIVATDAVEADRLNVLVEQSHLDSVKHVLHLGASEQGSDGLDDAIARETRTLAENSTALSELLEAEDSSLQATITFTSGSRGHSSQVIHTGTALLDHAKEVGDSFAMSTSDVTVISMDPSHPFERTVTMYPALVTGAVLAFPEDESTIDRALLEVRPTFAHLPADVVRAAAATVHGRFRRNRGFKRLVSLWWTRSTLKAVRSGKEPSALSKLLVGRHILRSLGWDNLRYLLVTGETVPVEVLSTLLAIGLPVRSGYVVVEAGLIAVGDPKDGWGLPATQGVTVGQSDGQLVVSGKGMGVGYADGSALALDDEGALITGDLGRVDEGLVHVQGPASSQIDLKDGRRLVAAEIERSLRDSQYIALAAIRLDAGVLRVDIEIDRDTVSDWAASRSLQFTTFSSLVELDEVKSLIADEVAQFAADVAHHDLLGTPLQQGRDITRTGRTIYRGFAIYDQGANSTSPENNESASAIE